MLKNIIILIFLLGLSCTSKKTQFEHNGGTFRMCIEHAPPSKSTSEISDYYSSTIYSQVMESLVSIDPQTLKIKEQIASSWTVNGKGTSYLFTIRNDVYFHDNPIFLSRQERNLTPEDIISSFEMMCKPSPKQPNSIAYSQVLKDAVIGAEEFHLNQTNTISGIRIVDGKIEINLKQRDDNFIYKLAQIQLSIHSKKTIDNQLTQLMIGTGPFMLKSIEKDKNITLVKNKEYYETDKKGNTLPYLDTIEFIIENNKYLQLELFENHKIDLILSLPASKISEIVEGRLEDFNSNPPKLILNKNPLLQSHYIFFNMEDDRFNNVKVRQAFNYALDREKIGREILKNQYDELGYYGITPPIINIFKGYDFRRIKKNGYEYNPVKAKKLLAEAGYPNGNGFGDVHLRFVVGDINSKVVNNFAQQIQQVLGINVNLDGSNLDYFILDATGGKGSLFKSSWMGDYPNPETFLNNFYSLNQPENSTNKNGFNYSKYNNDSFDFFLEKAKEETNMVKKLKNYSNAEIELMKDPPLIPLWYSGNLQVIHSNIRGLYFNPLSIFQLKKVYIKDWTAEEYQKEFSKK